MIMNKKRYRVALIGVTGYASIHLKNLFLPALMERLEMAAAVVVNPEQAVRACEHLRSIGCRIYSDVDSMWAEQQGCIDYCIIPTGIAWHRPMTIQALQMGANVLIEKPLAPTQEDVDAIIRAEEAARGFVAVGFQDFYQPYTRAAKRCLLDGDIGEIIRIKTKCLWPRGESYFHRNNWAGRIKDNNGRWVLDSPVNNAMAHYVSLELYFASQAYDEVSSIASIKAELYRVQQIENFDTVAFRAQAATGVELLFWGSHSCLEEVNPLIVVEGTGGRLFWTQSGGVRIESSRYGHKSIPAHSDSLVEQMHLALIARMDGAVTDICTAPMARPHVELVDALYRGFEITPVDPTCVASRNVDGDTFHFIPSLSPDTEQCFCDGTLYGEAGFSWTNLHIGACGTRKHSPR